MAHRVAMLSAILWACAVAEGAEVGVALLHDFERANTNEATRGVELRASFGGQGPRYAGDRWTVAVGYLERRGTGPIDDWVDTPRGCCGSAVELPAMTFVSAAHRWYALPKGPARFFAAVGLTYRDVETCVTRTTLGPFCWRGTAEVSSEWTFRLSVGVKLWGAVELSLEHDSTGKISTLNQGEDILRLGFVAGFGR